MPTVSSSSCQQFESYSAWRSNTSSPCTTTSQQQQMSRSKSAANKEEAGARRAVIGRSSSMASVSAPPANLGFSPTSATARSRAAFASEGGHGQGHSHSPGGSPLSSRYRARSRSNLASNLDDASFNDEDLTVMSETDLDGGGDRDFNMFGEQSQSIMLESSLGQVRTEEGRGGGVLVAFVIVRSLTFYSSFFCHFRFVLFCCQDFLNLFAPSD
jgi:hypothetical protein